jgi:hypothetical protein
MSLSLGGGRENTCQRWAQLSVQPCTPDGHVGHWGKDLELGGLKPVQKLQWVRAATCVPNHKAAGPSQFQ